MDIDKEDKNLSEYAILEMDAYNPDKVAERVLHVGVKKTRYPKTKTLILGMMGGGFISFGAIYELYILSHPSIGDSSAYIVAPFLYSVGYIMAFVSGAEIFTTNNLSAMALAAGEVRLVDVSINWTIVLFANIAGALFIVMLYYFSGLTELYDKAVVDTAKTLAAEKLSMSYMQFMIVGIFGNMLICTGLWLAMAGRTVVDKFIALLVPVAAVPALNFQHSTGNVFHFFLALITESDNVDLELPSEITLWAATSNIFFVSIGNIIGGGVLIALIYYFVFLKK